MFRFSDHLFHFALSKISLEKRVGSGLLVIEQKVAIINPHSVNKWLPFSNAEAIDPAAA